MMIAWKLMNLNLGFCVSTWNSSTKHHTITSLGWIQQTSRHLSNQSKGAWWLMVTNYFLVFYLFWPIYFILSPILSVFNNSYKITRWVYSLVWPWISATKSICTALPSSKHTTSFVPALTSLYDVDLLMAAAKVHSLTSEAACEEQGDPWPVFKYNFL